MGGSTAAQRRHCPGSYSLEATMPKQPASEFAARGSMLHAAMELLIVADPANVKEAEPLFAELIGQDMGFDGHEITQELVDDKLRPALEAWFEIVAEWGIDDWFIEQRVSLEAVVPGAFGTADIIAKDTKGRLHDLDWKFGDGVPVAVEENDGSAFYTVAALYDEDEEMKEFCANVSGIVFHIVQPRVGAEAVYQTWETTEEWLEAWLNQTVSSITAAQQPDPPIKPGPWCKWCDAKPICPAHKKLASEALGGKKPDAMTTVELADAMTKAELLKGWIADVFKLALHEMEQGAAVPGFKLVNKQPRRKWTDEKLAESTLKKRKVKVAVMYKRTLLTPAQMEKAIPKLYGEVLSDLVVLKSSGLTVVPDSDKRAAVASSMELLANAIPEQEK
jgi:hypothetical protein